MKTKIRYSRPPFWRILKIFFPTYDPDGSVSVAFGRTIYTNGKIPDDYLAHEEHHLRQQCRSYTIAVFWWILYLFSKRFRYRQELGAFGTQYKWILENWSWQRAAKLSEYARGLSSPLYGSLASFQEAQREILSYD